MTMDKDTVRFLQIFSARLVLECFGGGGAIWGFSEVITFRNPATQETWRFNAQVVGFIFFFRWLLQISDYLKKQTRDEASPSRLFQIFTARLVLEVFGGAGAIWYVPKMLFLVVFICASSYLLSTPSLISISFIGLWNKGGFPKPLPCAITKRRNSGGMQHLSLALSSSLVGAYK